MPVHTTTKDLACLQKVIALESGSPMNGKQSSQEIHSHAQAALMRLGMRRAYAQGFTNGKEELPKNTPTCLMRAPR